MGLHIFLRAGLSTKHPSMGWSIFQDIHFFWKKMRFQSVCICLSRQVCDNQCMHWRYRHILTSRVLFSSLESVVLNCWTRILHKTICVRWSDILSLKQCTESTLYWYDWVNTRVNCHLQGGISWICSYLWHGDTYLALHFRIMLLGYLTHYRAQRRGIESNSSLGSLY
jgi:hypothetical protein